MWPKDVLKKSKKMFCIKLNRDSCSIFFKVVDQCNQSEKKCLNYFLFFRIEIRTKKEKIFSLISNEVRSDEYAG